MTNLSYQKKLVLLFTTFFQIALFVVGGGLAMLPVIEEKFVKKYKVLSENDILDMIVLTQTVPGLIAVNSAVFVGTKIAGIIGGLVSVIAVISPSIFIILMIALCFQGLDSNNPFLLGAFSAVRACITGVFFITAYRLMKKVLISKLIGLMVFTFFVALLMRISPVLVLLSSIPLGYIYFYFAKRGVFPMLVEGQKK